MNKIVRRDDAAIVDSDPEAVAWPHPGINQVTQQIVVYVAGKSPAQELMVVNRIVTNKNGLAPRIQARAPDKTVIIDTVLKRRYVQQDPATQPGRHERTGRDREIARPRSHLQDRGCQVGMFILQIQGMLSRRTRRSLSLRPARSARSTPRARSRSSASLGHLTPVRSAVRPRYQASPGSAHHRRLAEDGDQEPLALRRRALHDRTSRLRRSGASTRGASDCTSAGQLGKSREYLLGLPVGIQKPL